MNDVCANCLTTLQKSPFVVEVFTGVRVQVMGSVIASSKAVIGVG